jgi:hypothetical protein
MIESDLGRTDPAEVGGIGAKTRRTPEAEDGDVRKPGAPLRLVHAQPGERVGQVSGELCRPTALVLEHDHPDAPRLAVADGLEDGALEAVGGGADLGRDPVDLGDRRAPEEDQRDVQVLRRDETDAARGRERGSLPCHEALASLAGERKRDEEAESFTALHVRPTLRAER